MLKKSTANPPAPVLAEAKSHKAGAPKTVPNRPGSASGHVLQSEAKPAGRNSSSSRYTAPRKEGSHNPLECGYTKPGKM